MWHTVAPPGAENQRHAVSREISMNMINISTLIEFLEDKRDRKCIIIPNIRGHITKVNDLMIFLMYLTVLLST